MKLKSFVFGKDKTPIWFNDVCKTGKAKINYGEENEIISATLYSPSGSKVVNIGDSIVYTNSGLSVIPQEKAKKYGIQRGKSNVEKNKEEEV
ncbi:MAG: hypothetical protein J6T10_22630 [Methanobrevibacter sp.]|nr:hypothetical protein [Methanobrevibacter sp.]